MLGNLTTPMITSGHGQVHSLLLVTTPSCDTIAWSWSYIGCGKCMFAMQTVLFTWVWFLYVAFLCWLKTLTPPFKNSNISQQNSLARATVQTFFSIKFKFIKHAVRTISHHFTSSWGNMPSPRKLLILTQCCFWKSRKSIFTSPCWGFHSRSD